jgi:hypothetical protein
VSAAVTGAPPPEIPIRGKPQGPEAKPKRLTSAAIRKSDIDAPAAHELLASLPPVPGRTISVERRFPTAREIGAGISRAQMLSLFGFPDVTATSSERGQIHERFVYVDRPTSRKTFVALTNGKVIFAETSSE